MYLETWDGGKTWRRHDCYGADGRLFPGTGWLKVSDTMHLMTENSFSADGGRTWYPDSLYYFGGFGYQEFVSMADSTTAYAMSSNGRNSLFKLNRHSVTVGVNEEPPSSLPILPTVKSFPSPAHEIVTLDFDRSFPDGLAFAKVYSITSALELEARVFVSAGRATLPVGGLVAGVHIVSLTSAQGVLTGIRSMRVLVR
jgi:hypothetical protein